MFSSDIVESGNSPMSVVETFSSSVVWISVEVNCDRRITLSSVESDQTLLD